MENESEGFGTLGISLLAAIVLVYLIMVALYNSFVYPFVVLFSIPLSFIGALLALGLTNNSLNIFTILGIIMLIGLVCKNARAGKRIPASPKFPPRTHKYHPQH